MTQLATQIQTWVEMLRSLTEREDGQDAMEYAVVAAVVVLAVAGAGAVFNTSISGAITAAFGVINTTITGLA